MVCCCGEFVLVIVVAGVEGGFCWLTGLWVCGLVCSIPWFWSCD